MIKKDLIKQLPINIKKQNPLVIGCSAGPDSMALLHYLLTNTKNPLIVAHINHNVRKQSNKEEITIKIKWKIILTSYLNTPPFYLLFTQLVFLPWEIKEITISREFEIAQQTGFQSYIESAFILHRTSFAYGTCIKTLIIHIVKPGHNYQLKTFFR